MTNLLLEYLGWQVLIWSALTGYIYVVAKIAERKADKDRANKDKNR